MNICAIILVDPTSNIYSFIYLRLTSLNKQVGVQQTNQMTVWLVQIVLFISSKNSPARALQLTKMENYFKTTETKTRIAFVFVPEAEKISCKFLCLFSCKYWANERERVGKDWEIIFLSKAHFDRYANLNFQRRDPQNFLMEKESNAIFSMKMM